jgi:ribosomal protein S18 acetylase RimI-like enzyme
MILRLATPADVDALADLGRRSFIAKFGNLYSAANLAKFLDATHTPDKAARELADPGMRVAVIEDHDAIVAMCKVTVVSTLPRHSDAYAPFELKQLYTDPGHVGRGLGADELQLSVYADNPDAQRFYSRYGLVKVADITFTVGDHVDPEFMMAVKL